MVITLELVVREEQSLYLGYIKNKKRYEIPQNKMCLFTWHLVSGLQENLSL